MTSDREIDPEPCLHCGTKTIQRVSGHPYCSMDCLNSRRREQSQRTYRCPYPECGWSTSYYPESALLKKEAYDEIDTHRNDHAESRASTQPIE